MLECICTSLLPFVFVRGLARGGSLDVSIRIVIRDARLRTCDSLEYANEHDPLLPVRYIPLLPVRYIQGSPSYPLPYNNVGKAIPFESALPVEFLLFKCKLVMYCHVGMSPQSTPLILWVEAICEPSASRDKQHHR